MIIKIIHVDALPIDGQIMLNVNGGLTTQAGEVVGTVLVIVTATTYVVLFVC